MRRIGWVLALAVVCVCTTDVASQQQQLFGGLGDKLPWAFPPRVEKPFPDDPAPRSLQGSSRKYTQAQIDDLLNPPDWFPDQHPTPPQVVAKGRGGALACGACHLMSGLGHPESSDLTGLTAPYIVQQMLDFKSGARTEPARMNAIAKDVSDAEAQQAAEYCAALPRRTFVTVMEAPMVPRTFLGNGRMRFVEPGGAMEPIGNRIIMVPDDQARARLRDPSAGFIAYVPPGSVARGKALVETGGGKTVACALCHGMGLHGQASIPRLAGMHPIYTVRQLYWFKDGTRKGIDAPLMQLPVVRLNDDDILSIAAYLASLAP